LALALVFGLVLVTAACGSGGGSGSNVTLPERPSSSLTTTTRPPVTTPTTAPTTTTTRPPRTTTSTSTSTTSTSTTSTTIATTTSTSAPTTTSSTSTTTAPTSTSESAATTATTAPSTNTASSSSNPWPWILLAVILVAIAVVIAALVNRSRNRRHAWQQQADGVVRDSKALTDLGASGPATPDPQQQIAHWSTLEQRTTALIASVAAASQVAPDDASRMALDGVDAAARSYLGAVQTTRQLHVGPPAPTAEQLQFADADRVQRLTSLQSTTDQLARVTNPTGTTA
jgi:hypothetical protein